MGEEEPPATHPGQVFANPELECAETMQAFIVASQESPAAILPRLGEVDNVK